MSVSFKIGDKAVYPSQGVAVVVGIESREISGNQEVFFVLRLLDTQKTILVPISKIASVGIRDVISPEEVRQVYDLLRQREIPADNQTWNRRYRRYLEKIKSGSAFDVAEVLRDLNLLKSDKALSFGERKMLDTARTLLVQELAVAEEVLPEAIETRLIDIFGAD